MSGYEWVILHPAFLFWCSVYQHIRACAHTRTLYKVFFNSSFYIPSVISGSQVHTFNSVPLTVSLFLSDSLYFKGSLEKIFLLLQAKELISFGWFPLQYTCFCLLLDIFCLFLWAFIISMQHGKGLFRSAFVCRIEGFNIIFKIQRKVKLCTYVQIYVH